MNNPRLLTGLLALAALLSGGLRTGAQTHTITSLDEIFDAAEQHSAQIRQALSAEKDAELNVSVARANRLPDIAAALSVGYNGNGFTTERDFSDYQTAHIPHFANGVSLSVAQPVYTGGAITAGIQLAELSLTASRFATELQRDNIRFQLTGFYLDIYKFRNLRAVVQNNIANARRVLDEMHERFAQGIALQNDITRYELLVSNLELQLIQIDNTIEILSQNLVTIAGLPENTAIEPDSAILIQSLPAHDQATWQQDAQTNAPAIKLAQSKLDISRKAETLARAERLPKIALRAGWNFDGPILVEVPPINRNLSYWYVGVGVSYNLSSLFKSNKDIAHKRAATIHAADELDVAAQNVDMTVRADYIKYLEAYQELKTRQKSVELAERNYSIVSTRYAADMALITDMLDAANSKLDAEQQLVNARINIIYSYYKLLFTSGKI